MEVAELNFRNHQIRTIYWFVIICILYIAFALVGNYVLISDEIYFDQFGEQLAYERIVEMVETGKKWRWLGYAILPIFILFRCFLVASCLTIGTLISGISVSFKNLFRIAMLAELVLFGPSIIKIFWFGVFHVDYTLQDLQFFSPLSVLSLMDRESVEPWLIYPLQLLNVFELVYWLVLAYGLYDLTRERYSKMLGLVAASYGTGLLLWVVFVVFLTINLSA
jgi:hypothetical protein